MGRVRPEPQEGRQGEGRHQVDHRLRHLHRPPGAIDGLVHLSDLSWSATGEEAIRNFKKGDEVEAVVLGIDVEKERISSASSSWKAIPYTNFIATHEKNSIVRGTVKSVDARGAVVGLEGDTEGYLRVPSSPAIVSKTCRSTSRSATRSRP